MPGRAVTVDIRSRTPRLNRRSLSKPAATLLESCQNQHCLPNEFVQIAGLNLATSGGTCTIAKAHLFKLRESYSITFLPSRTFARKGLLRRRAF